MSAIDLSRSPVIAAVKSEAQLDRALRTDCEVIFLLFGDILSIAALTEKVVAAGKQPIVHLDLIAGLASREIAADFIAKTTRAAGVISTKPLLLRRAKELGLLTVLRVFALDSMALANLEKEYALAAPDVVELLPGLMPSVIRTVSGSCPAPVIAGGLIAAKQDILAALQAGAVAVSTTDESIWNA